MSRAEIGDMGTILPSSNSKDSFLPCQKYCPLFNFLKEINYIKSFLFVLIFTLSMAICTYSGYLLFHLLKNFQLIKIFYLIIHSLLQGWNPPTFSEGTHLNSVFTTDTLLSLVRYCL